MIAESKYWKKPLLRIAKRLRRFKSQHELTNRSFVQIERDVFIGFYSIRKLFDSFGKVTDATRGLQTQLLWYRNIKLVTWRNKDDIEKCYDLAKSHRESRTARFICNKIIHSFVFIPTIGDLGGLAGIFFTSDTDKDNRLYSIEIDAVIEIFERVGNDDPCQIEWRRSSATGEETTTIT